MLQIYRPWSVALMLLGCWGIPLALLLPTMAEMWGRFGYSAQTFSCTILRDSNGHSPKKTFFLIGFFLPCLIIVLCYLRIFMVVQRSRRALATHRSPGGSGKEEKKGNESMTLTRMVLVIFCAFLLCYLPLMLANVFDERDTYPTLHVLASVLAWSAAVVNPFIYGVMSARYRQAYFSIFAVLPCFARCAKNIQISGGTGTSSKSYTAVNSIRLTETAVESP